MTEISDIDGLDNKIIIHMNNDTGAWDGFIFKPKGSRDTLQQCWEKVVDANSKLTATQKTRHKRTVITDPQR